MGGLVSIFGSEGGSGGKGLATTLFLDFENAKPTGDVETAVHAEVSKVLSLGQETLQNVKNYKGCDEQIRKAIASPSTDTEKAAWKALLPAVLLLKEIFDYSKELEAVFPKLLKALMSEDPNQSHEQQLGNQQALAQQLAEVLDFVLQFDDAKMVNPAIQNDFSYYRRSLARFKMSKDNTEEIVVKDELANRMSMFFAVSTPMMKMLTDTTTAFVQENSSTISTDSVTVGFALMANICNEMVNKKKFTSNDTNMFCLRCMTGSIILVDSINPTGAFHKKSPINIKGCITTLKGFTAESTDGLVNALRYNTQHANDPDTPGYVKTLLS